jgi:hypothetical protein
MAMQELSLFTTDLELHSLAPFDILCVEAEELVPGRKTYVLYAGSALEPGRRVALAVCRDENWAKQVFAAVQMSLGAGHLVCDLRAALRQPDPEELAAMRAAVNPGRRPTARVPVAAVANGPQAEKTPAQRAQEAVASGPLPPQEFHHPAPRGGAGAVQAPPESQQ